ncbi:unnamed protein product [Symbiodinium sp. CCMP2456]|nr:unnamed protein product [Symbiodinium sp. CCMP2456]
MLVVGCRHLTCCVGAKSACSHRGRRTRQLLTLRAAQFPDALANELSPTQAAYVGDPLFGLHSTSKGRVLQQAIVHTLTSSDDPATVQDAAPGLCVNGSKRAAHQSEFDFMYGGRRVECKGTSLAWSRACRSWRATWANIKFDKACFDDLFLALHTPGQIDVLRHDGTAFVSAQGARTAGLGHVVVVRGSTGLEDAGQACQGMLEKLQKRPNSCQNIGSIRTDSRFIEDLLAKERQNESTSLLSYWYRGVPLSNHSPCSRGLRLEKVAFAVDQMLHPGSTFSRVVPTVDEEEQRHSGGRRGADWVRDRTRVEFKSSMLRWDCNHKLWKVHFTCIKFATPSGLGEADWSIFDELWVGLYSPFGLYVVQYSGTFGRSTNGVATDVIGHDIKVLGPRHEESPHAALEVILRKLNSSGCELLATVTW